MIYNPSDTIAALGRDTSLCWGEA